MDIIKEKEKIIRIIESLKLNNLYLDKLGSISIRLDGSNILFSPYIQNKNITLDDISLIAINDKKLNLPCKNVENISIHRKIYESRKKVNAIIHTFSPGVIEKSTDMKVIPPILDDMAQIIGPTIKVADNSDDSILKSLKGRTAVLIKNNGGICTGRSLYESFVTCQVLEKSCRVYIEAKKIGGAKSIDMVIAYVMHQVYLKVYSKKRTKTSDSSL